MCLGVLVLQELYIQNLDGAFNSCMSESSKEVRKLFCTTDSCFLSMLTLRLAFSGNPVSSTPLSTGAQSAGGCE